MSSQDEGDDDEVERLVDVPQSTAAAAQNSIYNEDDERLNAHDPNLCVEEGASIYADHERAMRRALRKAGISPSVNDDIAKIVHEHKLALDMDAQHNTAARLTAQTILCVALLLELALLLLDIVVSDIGKRDSFETSHEVLFAFYVIATAVAFGASIAAFAYRAGNNMFASERRVRLTSAREKVVRKGHSYIASMLRHLSDRGCTSCAQSSTLAQMNDYLNGRGWMNVSPVYEDV